MDIVKYFLWSPDFLQADELQDRSMRLPPVADADPENAVTSGSIPNEEAAEVGDDADAMIHSERVGSRE